jgi:Ca2+-binding RTX toxin-like protein
MKKGTRRGVLLLASMLVMLVVVGGVAWAATLVGNDGPNTMKGTNGPDRIDGRGGGDWINGRGGADRMWGARGSDTIIDGSRGETYKDRISAGPGNDIINTNNTRNIRDVVTCGSGFDKWIADRNDYSLNLNACEDIRVY